jgi:hypothetical protein
MSVGRRRKSEEQTQTWYSFRTITALFEEVTSENALTLIFFFPSLLSIIHHYSKTHLSIIKFDL